MTRFVLGRGGYFFVITMISLLINTINRYDNLYKILNKELDYDSISEVLVMNNGVEPITLSHPKLKVVKPSWDVGLRSRWILGALANNQCLCVQDDDLIVDEIVFENLYGHFMLDNEKLCGVYGRKIDLLNSYKLDQFYSGFVDIILTRIACFNKALIPYLLQAETKVCQAQVSAKDWPGDDILLSYTALSVYNKKPFAIPISEQYIAELSSDYHLYKDPGFMAKRSCIIGKCKQMLCNEELYSIITEP